MASNISLGKGDSLSATTTKQVEYLTPNVTNTTGNHAVCDRLHIWNTGSTDVRIQVNVEADVFEPTNGILIPADENDYIFAFRNPIKKFAYATESDSTTIKYSAS